MRRLLACGLMMASLCGGFGQAALKAAQNAKLSPTTINGVPVDGRPIQFRSRFTLR